MAVIRKQKHGCEWSSVGRDARRPSLPFSITRVWDSILILITRLREFSREFFFFFFFSNQEKH